MVFTGNVNSDYVKLVTIPDSKKSDFIDYSATDFLVLRNKLIEYVKAVYPLEYQNFSESDLGMMLIELVAYMGSVLSLKADMLANENYLRTAKNRNNVKKLLELIGVQMRGPISSVANAKITLNSVSPTSQVTIPVASRVVTISSPEDGAPLNYTLYKITNGAIDTTNQDSSIVLNVSESNSTSSVWTNLAMIEGSLVVETGTFNSVESTKRIELARSPVAEKSVEVYIDTTNDSSGAWQLVDSIYFASGSTDKIFQVVYNDDFSATILFGDGITGKSPSYNATYYIKYRVGGGTRGNINSDIINTILNSSEGYTGSLENDSMATGGQDAETIDNAKKYAPYTFKRQDRLVTLNDYTTFANTFIGTTGSTAKARAVTREAFSSANTIDIYILQVASNTQLQQATTSFKQELLNAMNEKKMVTDEVVIVDGLVRTLDLVMTVRVNKDMLAKEELIKAKVRNIILSYFNVANMDFGKTLVLSDLARSIFSLNEVVFATVDNLDFDVVIDFNEIIQLNNFTINIIGV